MSFLYQDNITHANRSFAGLATRPAAAASLLATVFSQAGVARKSALTGAATAPATPATSLRRHGGLLRGGFGCIDLDGEVNHDMACFAADVGHANLVAIALANLVEQGQRVVVIDETHGLAVCERLQGAENGSVPKPFGHAPRIKFIGVENSSFVHVKPSFGAVQPLHKHAQTLKV
jgi:hypothetical protein